MRVHSEQLAQAVSDSGPEGRAFAVVVTVAVPMTLVVAVTVVVTMGMVTVVMMAAVIGMGVCGSTGALARGPCV